MNMKYKHAKVISHPRAGSHYFAKLLNANFFHRKDYIDLYAGHSDHHRNHLKVGSTAVFYIHRNNEDSLKSMYNMRDRFGIKARDYNTFLSTNLKDMRDMSIDSKTYYDNGEHKEIIKVVDGYLNKFNLTPELYLIKHKDFWLDMKGSNYYIVKYEDLINNFQDTMLLISKFLGSEKKVFNNLEQRIGWYDSKEEEKIFP